MSIVPSHLLLVRGLPYLADPIMGQRQIIGQKTAKAAGAAAATGAAVRLELGRRRLVVMQLCSEG